MLPDKKTQKRIITKAAAMLYTDTEAKGKEPHDDDYDNIALAVSREFGVSENEVRYLAEFPI